MAYRRRRNAPLPFSRKLALNQWLLGLFGVKCFDQLGRSLRGESLEGLDNVSVRTEVAATPMPCRGATATSGRSPGPSPTDVGWDDGSGQSRRLQHVSARRFR